MTSTAMSRVVTFVNATNTLTRSSEGSSFLDRCNGKGGVKMVVSIEWGCMGSAMIKVIILKLS